MTPERSVPNEMAAPLVVNLNRWSMSQLGEETVLLRELFSRGGQPGVEPQVFTGGFFVELGALNGLLLSNTRTLQTSMRWAGREY